MSIDGKTANFVIVEKPPGDGIFNFKIKAVDEAGNESSEIIEKIQIDASSPLSGGLIVFLNSKQLPSTEGGIQKIYSESQIRVGVSLTEDTQSASVLVGANKYELKKDSKTGLWLTDYFDYGYGNSNIYLDAEDYNKNKTSNMIIGEIEGVKKGKVLGSTSSFAGASLEVFQYNESNKKYEKFGNDSNPSLIKTNSIGEYDLVLPAGIYLIKIVTNTGEISVSTISKDSEGVVNEDFYISKKPWYGSWIKNKITLFKYGI